MRHGYGVRASAPFGLASHYRPNKNLRASLTSLRSNEVAGGGASGITAGADAAVERDRRVDDSRGGFVLRARSDDPPQRRRSLVEKSSNIKKSILSVSIWGICLAIFSTVADIKVCPYQNRPPLHPTFSNIQRTVACKIVV